MKADAFDFQPLLIAFDARDDALASVEAQRAFEAGAVPTASSSEEVIALAVWRDARDQGKDLFETWSRTPLLVEHLRSCAARGAVWAMAWLALDSFLSWTAPEDDDSVPSLTKEERGNHLRTAAESGHRRAARSLGIDNIDDAEALTYLAQAYADGRPEAEQNGGQARPLWRCADDYLMTSDLLSDTALEAARRSALLGLTDEANTWFSRSAYTTDWMSAETLRTRSGARQAFADWCEQQCRADQAEAIWQLLIDEAARDSMSDARSMRSEPKKYRDDWQLTHDRESARYWALRAEWERYAHVSPLRSERVAFLLSDNYFISSDDESIMTTYLESTPSGKSFLSHLTQQVLGFSLDEAQRSEVEERAAVVALLWWLVRDFESSWLDLLGLADAAASRRESLDALALQQETCATEFTLETQGRESALRSFDKPASAGYIIRARLLDHAMLDRPGSDGFRHERGGWAAPLGLAGTRSYLEGGQGSIPPLRGTSAGIALWLAGGQTLVRLIGEIGDELDELFGYVEFVLDTEEERESDETGPANEENVVRVHYQAMARKRELVQEHLRSQRRDLEGLLKGLAFPR